ncbi:hypothetical protein KI387_044496, partial [Taxus chinensis]
FDECFIPHYSSSSSMHPSSSSHLEDHLFEEIDEEVIDTFEGPIPLDVFTMPKWNCTIVSEAMPFIRDLPPTRNHHTHSTSSGLLCQNHTWDLVSLPKRRKMVRCKWVYQIKYAVDGSIDKYKALLVAKGFSQVEGIDYSDNFSPVSKMDFVCLVLAMFRRSLYSLKQAPRDWYDKMDSFLLSVGFVCYHSDHIVYLQYVGEDIVILILYVDDLLLTGSSSSHIHSIQKALSTQFDMKDHGILHYFFGL